MFIEFNVSNFRSIKEPHALSMAANNTKGLERNYFDSGIKGVPKLLFSTAMYGANAAGKSNFIEAIMFMRQFILSSSQDHLKGDLISVSPFKFDEKKCDEPSEFEIMFIKDNVRYQYGFSVTPQRVTGEWLFAYPEGQPQRWFERSYDSDKDEDQWYFGPKLRGKKKTWQSLTRKNALFLSTATQLNSEQLETIYDWFKDRLHIFNTESLSNGFTVEQCQDEQMKQKIVNFMNAADFSISGVTVTEEKLTMDVLPDDMPDSLKKEVFEDLKGRKVVDIKLMHPSPCGSREILIDLKDESAGTQKFFAYAGPLLDILGDGSTLFVDELNSSLHPLMIKFLVDLFHDPSKNKNNAQLVFTTHDTSILDKDILRRDQVWFFEKNNEDNSTQLYPLSDFKPRQNEALGKNYLQGKYGAIPFFGGFDF